MTPSDTRLRCVLLASAVVVVLLPSPAMALDFPEHIGEIVLRDVMWQDLPRQVRAVFVDRRDRVWYQLCHPARAEDLEVVRRIIRREFTRPSPQIFGAAPVLFEPGGRVWFVTHSQSVLIGYDGKEWIERRAADGHYFPGSCPNHGRNYRTACSTGCHLFAAGTAFFLESHGAVALSKGEWSYQQMTEKPASQRSTPRYPSLYLEQDGKGVTAWMPGADGASLWRWRGGKWREVPLPDAIKAADLAAVAPWQDGVWLFTKTGPVYHAYHRGESGEFQRLLKGLGDDSYRVREEAMRRMIALGPAVLKQASDAHREADDLEVRARLQRVIDTLTHTAGQAVSFGPYQLTGAQLAFYGADATVYVTADDVTERGKSLGPGLVVGQGDGTFRAVAASGLPQRWGSPSSDDSGPLVLESGKRIWLPGSSGESGPGLLDLDKGQFTLAMPDPRVRWLHAVKSDGTIFAGRCEPGQSWARPVMVFQPSAPDNRNILQSDRVELDGGRRVGITSDGRIWAQVADRGLLRFDGEKWDQVEGVPVRNLRDFLPGGDGSAIITTGNSCVLVTADEVVERGSVKDLVSSRPEAVARLFKNGGDTDRLSIAPDDQGNIWLRESYKLSVLVGGQWLEAADRLKEAGARTGNIGYLGLCGTGARVYVTDFMMVHDRGSSQLGEVSGGRLRFSKAPHTCQDRFMHLNIRDRSGGLWVPGSVRGSGGTCDWISGQLALRITGEGAVGQWKNAGWATLADQGGNVWLGSIRGQEQDVFNIWREGRTVHTVAVPGAFERCALVSDKPGSVFVWTRLGLRHVVADDPARPGAYALGKLYTVPAFEGAEQVAGFSRLGLLAVTTCRDRPGSRKYYLYLIRLPGSGAAPSPFAPRK